MSSVVNNAPKLEHGKMSKKRGSVIFFSHAGGKYQTEFSIRIKQVTN